MKLSTDENKLDERIKIFDPIMNKLKDKVDLIRNKGKYTKLGKYFEYLISDTIKNIKKFNYFYVGDDEEGENLKRQVPKLRKSLGNYTSLKVNLSGSDESKLKKYLYDSFRDGILDGRGEDMDRDDVHFYIAHWLMDNGFTTPFKLHETKSVKKSVNEISWAEMQRIDAIQKDIKSHISKNYKDEIAQKKDRWMKSYSDLVGHSGKGLNKKNLKNIVKLAKQKNDKKLLQLVVSLSKTTKKSVNESPVTITKQDMNKLHSGEEVEIDGHLLKFVDESVNEDEQLDEKLITFSNRAPYGQVVFMAGGAGSGKGFAISNFIDSAGFKVRDVDEMKKQVGKLDKLGKISVDSWYKRYSGNLSPDAREHVEKYVINKGLTISDIAGDLKNPNNVASLHFIVDAMGIKEKWLINMLSGKNNPETLPNLIFDITAKNIKSITKTIPTLISQGYKPQNIHLIWVLTNYYIAVQQNQERARVVPDDIMLKSHEGAAKTIWSIVTGALPKGLNGRIDVILGGAKNTVKYKDSKGNELDGAIKGFTTLPVKKQGGGVLPEKQWLDILYKWVSNNTPKTITLQKPLDTQMGG